MTMFRIDNKDIRRMEGDLKAFAERALPFATKNTLNQAAFMAQREAREGVRKTMTIRNQFTERSIQVDQARTLNIRQQAAIVGSIADYMEVQEFGGFKARKGKEGVAIPTSYSAGQGEGVQPRTRLPRKPNRMANIRLQGRSKGRGSRKQRNFVAVKQAASSGSKYVFLDLGRRKGIFKVTGGKRRPKIKMVHDLSLQSVTIPKSPWLGPAVAATVPQIPQLYAASLRFQLKRLGLFR